MCPKIHTQLFIKQFLNSAWYFFFFPPRKFNLLKTAQSIFTVIRQLKKIRPENFFAWNNRAERYKIYHSPSYISLSFHFNWILCLGMNLSLNIAASNGPRLFGINKLGIRFVEQWKRGGGEEEEVYNCVGKTVRKAGGVTMTVGAVLWADGWAADASIITLAGFYRNRLHNESQRMQTGAVPRQQHTVDFCLRPSNIVTRYQVPLNPLPHNEHNWL